MQVIYIDYASEGNSGFYTARIIESYNLNVPFLAFVHSGYSYTPSNKRVIKIFDNFSKFIKFRPAKLFIRYIDIYLCFLIILIRLKIKSANKKLIVILNFHQSFHSYKFFTSALSRFSRVFIVVHDAIELKHKYPSCIMSDRDEILNYADSLVVHGEDSIEKLSYLSKKIYQIPFPVNKNHKIKFSKKNLDEEIKFLFIGHIRAEKGVDILLGAWRGMPQSYLSKAKLVIAGTYDPSLAYDFSNINNCEIKNQYLSDEDFVRLILESDYVVMPYTGGTNSGVLSVAASLNRPCITSSIPVFSDSPFGIAELMYKEENALQDCIKRAINNHQTRYMPMLNNLKKKCSDYNVNFDNEINSFYKKITNEY